jgi:hypothetical protein
MGGIRAKPDTKKITVSREGYGITYAFSHMCGKNSVFQGGDSIWRMHI